MCNHLASSLQVSMHHRPTVPPPTKLLRRFLARAAASSLSSSASTSTVHKGTSFEKRARALLEQHFSMTLDHVGGKSDGGVDLQGWWWVPVATTLQYPDPRVPIPLVSATRPPKGVTTTTTTTTIPRKRIRVLAQCKAESKKFGPSYVRELEGVLHRYFAEQSSSSSSSSPSSPSSPLRPPPDPLQSCQTVVVGALISQSPFTKASLLRAQSSTIPLFLLHLPPLDDPGTKQTNARSRNEGSGGFPSSAATTTTATTTEGCVIGSLVFNNALSCSSGPLGGEVEARWEWSLRRPLQGRPSLWWNGRRVPSWVPEMKEPLSARDLDTGIVADTSR